MERCERDTVQIPGTKIARERAILDALVLDKTANAKRMLCDGW